MAMSGTRYDRIIKEFVLKWDALNLHLNYYKILKDKNYSYEIDEIQTTYSMLSLTFLYF